MQPNCNINEQQTAKQMCFFFFFQNNKYFNIHTRIRENVLKKTDSDIYPKEAKQMCWYLLTRRGKKIEVEFELQIQ